MKFKEINSRKDVAEFLNISDKGLRYALYGKGLSSFYDTFTVKKHDGSVRMINAPLGANVVNLVAINPKIEDNQL